MKINPYIFREYDIRGKVVEDFPPEVKMDGFDNNGAGLVTSGLLLNHYLNTASEAIKRSTDFRPKPKIRLKAPLLP